MKTSKKLKRILTNTIDSLTASKDKFLIKPDTDFSRVQKISFNQTMLFPIVAQSKSISEEMIDMFDPKNIPSAAALVYRRNQIHFSAFETLFYRFSKQIIGNELFHGMRLIACDGSKLDMPYNPKEEFSYCDSTQKGFNKLLLNACYDIQNDCFIDAVIQGVHEMDEFKALCQMMDRYSLETLPLFIADRGYFSYNLIAHAIHNDQKFLIRVKSSAANSLFSDREDLETMNNLDTFDVTDVIHIGRRRNKKTKSLYNYHYVPKDRTYDYIEVGSDVVETFTVRLLKFPISENTTEYIVTNLEEDRFPLSVIKELYGERWQIETAFRFLKHKEELKTVHSKKRNSIFQEIYAKLTCYNFCAVVKASLEKRNPKKTKKYTYNLNKSYLIHLCMLFLKGKAIEVEQLALQKKEPERKGRQFNRK